MLLLFLLVLLLLLFVFAFFVFFFFRDSDMIPIGTVEFRYYVVVITPVNFGKP